MHSVNYGQATAKKDSRMAALLASLYRDYLNDYLTVAHFAEDHEVSIADAAALIEMGRKYHGEGY